jgi:hypothetical protein
VASCKAFMLQMEFDERAFDVGGALKGLLNTFDGAAAPLQPVIASSPCPEIEYKAPEAAAPRKAIRKKAPRSDASPKTESHALRAGGGSGGSRQKIKDYLSKTGSASRREICNGTGLSYPTVCNVINAGLGDDYRATGSGSTFELMPQ